MQENSILRYEAVYDDMYICTYVMPDFKRWPTLQTTYIRAGQVFNLYSVCARTHLHVRNYVCAQGSLHWRYVLTGK